VKGTFIRDADFFNFPQPDPYPDEDHGSSTAFVKMGIKELCSPFPPTKDYCKERTQRAKGVIRYQQDPLLLKYRLGGK
jgi:hypothetical protein